MLIDDRTRRRIILVIFVCFMTGALGIKNLVLTVLAVVLVAAVVAAVRRRMAVRAAEEEARRDEILKRMETQHQQRLAGDDRGTYGDGYDAHRAYQDAAALRMPKTRRKPPGQAGG